ncbi:hypothetical protein N9J72_02550 [Candidatus Gracilibacteria bacterium]|nr:hypothetical protein [Candidatus Gracilibacteria bacterium]
MKTYQKYLPEGCEIHAVIHQHWMTVIQSYILWLTFGAFIPAFLYIQSQRIQDIVPFFAVEIWLFLIFVKIVYELFNWYHDVWIVADGAIYDLEWSLFKTNLENLHYENIEGIEIDKHRIWDSIFNKGDIVIHKFGEDELAILNAAAPYEAVEILEGFIHPKDEEDDKDRFDMIMDALGGVVSEHLKKHGVHTDLEASETENKKTSGYEYDEKYTINLNSDGQDSRHSQ